MPIRAKPTQENKMLARNFNVIEVEINGMSGYQVQGWYRDCSDSMFETVAHAAVFRDRARAERFLKRSKPFPKDWKHWGKPVDHMPHPADAFSG
jgi:hypothetical protein